MADNITNVPLPSGEWVDLYSASGVSIGDAIAVENIGVCDVRLAVLATQPPPNHEAFNILRRDNEVLRCAQGASGAWAFCGNTNGKVAVRVIDDANGFYPELGDSLTLKDTDGNLIGPATKAKQEEQLARDGLAAGSPDSGSGKLGWLETIADRTLVADAGEREYTHVATSVTASGDTIIHTPASGNRIRLWWIYALNNPASDNPRKITISIGSTDYYTTYGVSKRQKITGGIDEPLIINLSGSGDVAVTAVLEEI